MRHGSLFSGIGGFDLGFERAGWDITWQVEREPFCQAVLASHWPAAQRFADIRDVGVRNLEPVDCITAGVPCQDVSVAGKRAGLAGSRTGLFYEFARILHELRPAWFVFENVPGLLSSKRGRDFAEVLRVLMVECGYGVSWRVLDSRFFGVAQRRRRVFIVGSFGKPCPAAILFESASGGGDPARGGETGQDVALALAASVRGTGDGHGNAWNSNYVARPLAQTAFKRHDEDRDTIVVAPITAGLAKLRHDQDGYPEHLIAAPLSAGSCDGGHAGGRRREDDFNLVATLNSGGNDGGFRTEPGEHLVARPLRSGRTIADSYGDEGNIVGAPTDADGMRDVAGLPEGLDSARYRALGNAVTVQVAEWIARRIMEQG